MTRKLILGLFLGLSFLSAFAQQTTTTPAADAMKTPTPEVASYSTFAPSDMWEIGFSAGYAAMEGAIPYDPSFGVGLHVRKALDHIFSLRLDGNYLATKGTAAGSDSYPATYDSGKNIIKWDSPLYNLSAEIVIAINNSRLDAGIRKISPYVLAGAGGAYSDTKLTYTDGTTATLQPGGRLTSNYVPYAEAGVGVAFRVSDKFNIGIEEKLSRIFGKRADVVDGHAARGQDIFSYTNIRFNFNVGGGKGSTKTLPLWWVGQADKINADIAELKARPKFDPTDTDGDGVPDMWDLEKDTPAGAKVDTHGVALDSDGDGIPDYKDKEPFSPPGYKVDANGVAMVPKPSYVTETDVDRIVSGKLAQWDASKSSMTMKGGVSDWFLPMIHFDFNKATIKESDFGNLRNIANVLKSNPALKVVVTGYTDRVSSESYNQTLSYKRAEMAVDHLVKKEGVDRSRLVVNYKGEEDVLVNTKSADYMNRRVEFKVATSETEMAAPSREMKMKKHKGNKNAGF